MYWTYCSMINAYRSFIQYLFCSSIPTASNPTPQLNFFAVYSDPASLTGYLDSITVFSFPHFLPRIHFIQLPAALITYVPSLLSLWLWNPTFHTLICPPTPSPAQHLLPHPTPILSTTPPQPSLFRENSGAVSPSHMQRAQACSETILPAPQTLMASIPYRTLALSKCSASGAMSYCFCCAVATLRTYKCPNLFRLAYKVYSTLWQIRNADDCICI